MAGGPSTAAHPPRPARPTERATWRCRDGPLQHLDIVAVATHDLDGVNAKLGQPGDGFVVPPAGRAGPPRGARSSSRRIAELGCGARRRPWVPNANTSTAGAAIVGANGQLRRQVAPPGSGRRRRPANGDSTQMAAMPSRYTWSTAVAAAWVMCLARSTCPSQTRRTMPPLLRTTYAAAGSSRVISPAAYIPRPVATTTVTPSASRPPSCRRMSLSGPRPGRVSVPSNRARGVGVGGYSSSSAPPLSSRSAPASSNSSSSGISPASMRRSMGSYSPGRSSPISSLI